MRRSKRFLSVLLALVLCLSMLPVNALALELPALDVLEDVIAVVEEEDAVEDAEPAEVEESVEESEEPRPAEESTGVAELLGLQVSSSVLMAGSKLTLKGSDFTSNIYLAAALQKILDSFPPRNGSGTTFNLGNYYTDPLTGESVDYSDGTECYAYGDWCLYILTGKEQVCKPINIPEKQR